MTEIRRTIGSTHGIASIFIAVCCVAAAPAEAKIRCNGPYQIVSGNQLATPYCLDSYLATIALEYGMKVTAREMREDYGRKQDVCRLVGQDIRIREYCSQFVPQARGRGGL